MNLKRLGAIAGAVLVSGALLTGGAFAATGNLPAKVSDKLQSAVQSGKLTQNQADVMTKLFNLRQDAMTKLKADQKAVIDQAVKDGKLTQDQADKLATRGDHFGEKGHGGHEGKGERDRSSFKGLTKDQLKAKLDAAVKAGKLTQEKADQILAKWESRPQQQVQPQPQPQSPNGQ